MSAIKLVSSIVTKSKDSVTVFNGLSAGSINVKSFATGEFADYIALHHAHNATLAELEKRAYALMCDVATVDEFEVVRVAFYEAYKADYVKRFKQGDLSEKDWTKKIANATGVAWKRVWERAQAHTGVGVTPWVSPVVPKTRTTKSASDADKGTGDASTVDAANPQNSIARPIVPEVPEALTSVIAWAMSDASNLEALVAWHAEQSKPKLEVVKTRKPRAPKVA